MSVCSDGEKNVLHHIHNKQTNISIRLEKDWKSIPFWRKNARTLDLFFIRNGSNLSTMRMRELAARSQHAVLERPQTELRWVTHAICFYFDVSYNYGAQTSYINVPSVRGVRESLCKFPISSRNISTSFVNETLVEVQRVVWVGYTREREGDGKECIDCISVSVWHGTAVIIYRRTVNIVQTMYVVCEKRYNILKHSDSNSPRSTSPPASVECRAKVKWRRR